MWISQVWIRAFHSTILVAYLLLLPISLAMLKPGRLLLCPLRTVYLARHAGMHDTTLLPRLHQCNSPAGSLDMSWQGLEALRGIDD